MQVPRIPKFGQYSWTICSLSWISFVYWLHDIYDQIAVLSHPEFPDTLNASERCLKPASLRTPGITKASNQKYFTHWKLSHGGICVRAQSLLLCLTLCDPVGCNPPGSSVHGTLLARILEWVAMSFPRRSSQPRDQIHVSCISCIAGRSYTHWTTWEASWWYRGEQKWRVEIYLLLRAGVSIFLLHILSLSTYHFIWTLGAWENTEKWTLDGIEELYSSRALLTVKWK